MDIVSTILALLPLAQRVVGGVADLWRLIATLHAGGQISDADVQRLRDEGAIADAEYDAALADAKARLAGTAPAAGAPLSPSPMSPPNATVAVDPLADVT